MKIHFCLILILIGFTVEASGQQRRMPTTPRIDTKALFQMVAESVTKGTDPKSIKYYSIKVSEIVSQSSDPEQTAAIFLIELQGRNPRGIIDNINRRQFKPAGPGQIGLNADKFIISYLKALTLYCSRNEEDPIAQALNDISTSEVRISARKFGKDWGEYTEERITELVIETKKEIDRIGVGNLDTPGLRLFFPLCLVTKGGC